MLVPLLLATGSRVEGGWADSTRLGLGQFNPPRPLWAPLGPLWASLGPLWAPLGPLWASLGPLWAPLGPLWAPHGPLWAPRLALCQFNPPRPWPI